MRIIKDLIFQQHNTAEDNVCISKAQMLQILDATELPSSLAPRLVPHEFMNGKQLAIKFKSSDGEVVQERVVFETGIRYEAESGQNAGVGFFSEDSSSASPELEAGAHPGLTSR